jgi:glycosyltransferase involved in cell wall biosynthesis
MEQDAELTVIGGGSALEEMKRRSANATNVRYLPAVRNEEVPRYLQDLHVLVLPSRSTTQWVEQFGHILLEAMACGVTVVGSSSGEIPNVIGDAGRVFTEGDVAALKTVLNELATNEAERVMLAAMAIERVRRYFTNDAIAEKQMSFFERLLASRATVTARQTTAVTKELTAV